MENNTNIKIPKKYSGKIFAVDYMAGQYHAWAKTGYTFAHVGCGVAIEETQQDLLESIRTIEEE